MKRLGTSKITPRLRIQLVKTVADKLGADDGDFIDFYEDKGNIIIKKAD